jgi:hypothetical protein
MSRVLGCVIWEYYTLVRVVKRFWMMIGITTVRLFLEEVFLFKERESMFNVKKVGMGFMDQVLLPEHRDEFTKVHLAKLLHENCAKTKKFIKGIGDKVYTELLNAEEQAEVKKTAFSKEFVEGVHEWAENWTRNEFPRRLEQYELGVEVCEHNTRILVDEVVPCMKDKLKEKFSILVGNCKE